MTCKKCKKSHFKTATINNKKECNEDKDKLHTRITWNAGNTLEEIKLKNQFINYISAHYPNANIDNIKLNSTRMDTSPLVTETTTTITFIKLEKSAQYIH